MTGFSVLCSALVFFAYVLISQGALQRFQAPGVNITLNTTPGSFLEAVKACANLGLTLTPTALLPQLHINLAASQEDAKRLLELIGRTPKDSSAQEGWSLWTWDEYRACHAAKLLTDRDNEDGYLVTAARPCAWRLPGVCVDQGAVEAAGLESASKWYARHFPDGAGDLAPLPRADREAMTLVQGAVYGGGDLPGDTMLQFGLTDNFTCARCKNITYGDFTAEYDDSAEAFLARGPVVSAQFSVYDAVAGTRAHKLVSLRLVREDDLAGDEAAAQQEALLMAAQLRNQSLPISGALGLDPVALGEESHYRSILHEGLSMYDYIVSVQGCFRLQDRPGIPFSEPLKLLSDHLEALYLTTRTGRQYQLGRGGCTGWFREDAPPGGYLAGIRGVHINSTQWRILNRSLVEVGLWDLPWIRQVRFVWATKTTATSAPTAATNNGLADQPTSTIRPASTLPGPACPRQNQWVTAYQTDLYVPPHCGWGPVRATCPSNMCCGDRVRIVTAGAGDTTASVTATSGYEMYTCSADAASCGMCNDGYGMCGGVPEARFSLFVRSDPAAVAADGNAAQDAAVYFLAANPNLQLPYVNATQYCSTANHLGLPWVMVTVDDVLGWFTSAVTRQALYDNLNGGVGSFWVESGPASGTCIQVAYNTLLPSADANSDAADAFTFRAAPCDSVGISSVFCKLAPSWSTGGPVGSREAAWAAGPHRLSWSPYIGRPTTTTNCARTRKERALLWPSAVAAGAAPNETATAAGALIVDGAVAANGAVIANGTIYVYGAISSNETMAANGTLVAFEPTVTNRTIVITGTVVANGTDVARGVVIVSGAAVANGTAIVKGTITVNGAVMDGAAGGSTDGTAVVIRGTVTSAGIVMATGTTVVYLTKTPGGTIVANGTMVAMGTVATNRTYIINGTVLSNATDLTNGIIRVSGLVRNNGTVTAEGTTTPDGTVIAGGVVVASGRVSGALAFSKGSYSTIAQAAVDIAQEAATAAAAAADGLTEALLARPITRIGVSMAAQIPDLINAVKVVSAIKVWAGGDDKDAAAAAASTGAGITSSDGFHMLELYSGEVVVAVSGCWGGFLERLVFHTSRGRRWSTPFDAHSVCSASFLETAPPGGYLVGIKVDFGGRWIESAKLLWGQPEATPSTLGGVQSPPKGGARIGVIVGAAVGGSIALVALLCVCCWWRVRCPSSTGLVGGMGPVKGQWRWWCCWPGRAPGGAYRPKQHLPPPPHPPAGVGNLEDKLSAYEERLNAFMRAGDGGVNGAMPGPDPALSMVAVELTDETKLKISSAITELHAEMSDGRQEQLHVASLLGQGSFGVVYLGVWRGLQVAIKTMVVRDALMGAEGRRRHRAVLEAAISKSLQHPNVVTTYAAEVVRLVAVAPQPAAAGPSSSTSATTGETRGSAVLSLGEEGGGVEDATPDAGGASEPTGDVFKLYIIQEYCNVGSLSTALGAGVVGSVASGGATSLCALTLALDVACGMSHIHAKNIVHGDLSAANVLLSSCGRGPGCAGPGQPAADEGRGGGGSGCGDGEGDVESLRRPLQGLWRPPVMAKVSDFGLSMYMSQGETHASNCFQGTPAYLAPEVINRGHLSKAADVWAFGVLLLELCHGLKIGEIRARSGPAPALTPVFLQGVSPPGPVPASAAAAPPLRIGGLGGGGSGPSGAPYWAVPPASCPGGVSELVFSCLRREPSARPPFVQVAGALVEVLRVEHERLRGGASATAAGAAGAGVARAHG